MFNAQLAREMAIHYKPENSPEFRNLLSALEKAARKGLRSYRYYQTLRPADCERMKELGFKISVVGCRSFPLWHRIRW